jgi:membrane protease YdiL (CAAX protease family)
MNTFRTSPPGFWTTVRLLLATARRRSSGRRDRQQQLLHNRAGRRPAFGSGLGSAFTTLFTTILNVIAAVVLITGVTTAEKSAADPQGKIVVSYNFLHSLSHAQSLKDSQPGDDPLDASDYFNEAKRIARRTGGDEQEIVRRLRDSVRNYGSRDLVTMNRSSPRFSAFLKTGPVPPMLGSMVLIWWIVMLVFQGEGLELDLQRRRHPMWEWLFSHPVQPGAVFLAEMLSPIAANPIYWTAPVFVAIVYSFVYDPFLGLAGGIAVGIPVTVAAGCLGKALEIAVVLRFSPRSRGALIGLMSWLGYASLMLFFLGMAVVPKMIAAAGPVLGRLAVIPWPWLRLFAGGQANGSFSFLSAVFNCWIASAATIAVAVWFSVWGAQQGLSGNFGAADSRPASVRNGGTRFGKDPLYRKELLWFIRDRSAIVQTILIPLTLAGFQLFNLRGILSRAQGEWNYLSGAGILFGTYFLWILGPKSLLSEGTALWIALTWPRGLESLLKAKAWLWSLVSGAFVAIVLCYAAFLFPANLWQIAVVGLGWFVFSRSMAEKTVTLVTITSSSGEPQKLPRGHRIAAQLGMLTFCIGILTEQWHIAMMGIVYSYLTAAAIWEHFRARLPYLYDSWSERLPPPPTLMHAMVAISALVEGGAVVTGIIAAVAGRENIAVAKALSYAICAVAVSVGVWNFLSEREVTLRQVWCWNTDRLSNWKLLQQILFGAGSGIGLGGFAVAYLAILRHIPAAAEVIRKSQEQAAKIPNFRISYAIMAVAFAPFAEEYLFRGLLYRALDRQWGGWRAIVGSAAFFAVYHPPLSWPPVFLLGIANAVLFKKTGRLLPAVALHMFYNAVVIS